MRPQRLCRPPTATGTPPVKAPRYCAPWRALRSPGLPVSSSSRSARASARTTLRTRVFAATWTHSLSGGIMASYRPEARRLQSDRHDWAVGRPHRGRPGRQVRIDRQPEALRRAAAEDFVVVLALPSTPRGWCVASGRRSIHGIRLPCRSGREMLGLGVAPRAFARNDATIASRMATGVGEELVHLRVARPVLAQQLRICLAPPPDAAW